MIDFNVLNPLIEQAFAGKTTLLEVSTGYSINELIDAFYSTRPRILVSLEDLSDAQVAFTSPVHPFWSISETITHLMFSQNLYMNKMLDVSTSQLPHAMEAARGFGEGAKTNVPAQLLREQMAAATKQIQGVIEDTRHKHDPDKTEVHDFFGVCNYKVWMLILLVHELDHLRQLIAMRRLARSEA